MESGFTWEYETLINELTQGMEKAKLLQFHLCSTTSPSDTQHLLLQRILSSYEKSLSILNWRGPFGQLSVAAPPPTSGGGAPESSISVDGSPTSDEQNKNSGDRNKDCKYGTSKKRKIQPTWTEQVRVNPENGLEGPTDDGYSWRKYGQKDILGAKHPRSYYRCTYRLAQNCWSTKQVQRSDDDPTIFEITYKGAHTCNQQLANAVPPPPSPEKQELKHNSHNHHLQQEHNQTLVNLKNNLRVSTDSTDSIYTPPQFSFQSTNDRENYYLPISAFVGENHLCQYSPQFLSPTSETNYFGGTDIGEIISGHASTTNSPIGRMEFPFDPVDLDPNFPFNTSGFFT